MHLPGYEDKMEELSTREIPRWGVGGGGGGGGGVAYRPNKIHMHSHYVTESITHAAIILLTLASKYQMSV